MSAKIAIFLTPPTQSLCWRNIGMVSNKSGQWETWRSNLVIKVFGIWHLDFETRYVATSYVYCMYFHLLLNYRTIKRLGNQFVQWFIAQTSAHYRYWYSSCLCLMIWFFWGGRQIDFLLLKRILSSKMKGTQNYYQM